MLNQPLIWDAKFEIGVEEIDQQHRFFLSLINRLSIELERNDNQKYLLALFSELNAYARFHFISEENIMLRAAYPNLEEHRRQHLELVEQLHAKEWKLRSRSSAEEGGHIVAFLVQWFLVHTSQEDKQFADFLLS
ncbi:MAG: hemerythrin family protein [Desulfobulbaceae bacterium]|nr:hemerythrin family protein [Desulfobulbaceae bacterium]HIJ90451.1 hemerythrin family protein [Deltaproteobacteria bacterium]